MHKQSISLFGSEDGMLSLQQEGCFFAVITPSPTRDLTHSFFLHLHTCFVFRMDSKSAPPRRRQPFQLYVPVHRRTANTMTTTEVNSPSPSPPPPPERRHVQTSVPTGDTVVRRGRGQFRAPPTEQSEAEKPKRSTPIDKYTDVYAQRVYSTNDRYKTRRWSPPSAVAQTTATITEPFKRNDLQQQHNSNKKKDEMEELTASLSAFSVTNKDDTTSDSSSSSKEEWENLLDELSEDEDNKNNSNNKTESKRATSAPIDRMSYFPFLPLLFFQLAKREIEYTEATTVLDCYDFPASFKTHHLHSIFQSYEGGYRIQWVHDTRALIIFESPGIGKREKQAIVGLKSF